MATKRPKEYTNGFTAGYEHFPGAAPRRARRADIASRVHDAQLLPAGTRQGSSDEYDNVTVATEEEALKRACVQTVDRNPYDQCIGSRCMAWRWRDPSRKLKHPERYTGMNATLRIGLASDDEFEPMPNRRGYCGLAGKPEEY